MREPFALGGDDAPIALEVPDEFVNGEHVVLLGNYSTT
jgi:hypothetical protein